MTGTLQDGSKVERDKARGRTRRRGKLTLAEVRRIQDVLIRGLTAFEGITLPAVSQVFNGLSVSTIRRLLKDHQVERVARATEADVDARLDAQSEAADAPHND